MQRRSKYRYRRSRAKGAGPAPVLLKTGVGMLAIALLSLFFVFCYDALTQCRYFAIRQIGISGADRISEERILHLVALRPGMNVLGVNLSVARKRLLSHPWISEAAVGRVIPSGLRIVIRERQPLAIIDLGRRFLIDDNGKIFKELERGDPQDLPVIRGLGYADIDLPCPPRPSAFRSAEAIAATAFEKSSTHRSVYGAAVNALVLLRRHAAILQGEHVGFVQVDREIGVTIHTLDRKRSIQMGFNEYARKLDMLGSALDFVRDSKSWRLGEIESIDLKNPDRVVVNLSGKKEE